MFDSRSRIWYVRASTCSKEAVILIDTSGSMYGMKNTIAQMTVDSLLNTMGTNDYLNVYAFNNAVYPIVPCFDNMLVQVLTYCYYIPMVFRFFFKRSLIKGCLSLLEIEWWCSK